MSPANYFSEWHHLEIIMSVHLCFSLTSGGLNAAVLGPSAISIQRKRRREERRNKERGKEKKNKERRGVTRKEERTGGTKREER